MKSSAKVLLGVVAGLAAGAVLGILFAPDKGCETRCKIAKKGEDLSDAVKEKFSELIDGITEKFEKCKETVKEFTEKEKTVENEPGEM
ncbi:MAG: YtxH domain-containing protein [Bacteroidota bacterium]|nr:YtxH domain-containing protein [Bacteroidota bacterium]MDP4205963.1 YtxH domain-containing protein [Bacteroidota bacterium]